MDRGDSEGSARRAPRALEVLEVLEAVLAELAACARAVRDADIEAGLRCAACADLREAYSDALLAAFGGLAPRGEAADAMTLTEVWEVNHAFDFHGRAYAAPRGRARALRASLARAAARLGAGGPAAWAAVGRAARAAYYLAGCDAVRPRLAAAVAAAAGNL